MYSINSKFTENYNRLPVRCQRGRALDIVNILDKITPDVELHIIDQGDDGRIRKASYCGPQTKLYNRLENFDPNTGSYTGIITEPINDLDRACLKHDLVYNSKDLQERLKADVELKKVADKIYKSKDSTLIQKFNAGLVKLIMAGKVKLGVGLGNNIQSGENIFSNVVGKLTDSTFGGPNRSLLGALVGLVGAIGIPATIAIVNKIKNDNKV